MKIVGTVMLAGILLAVMGGCATRPTDDRKLDGYAVSGLEEGGCLVGSIGKDLEGEDSAPFGWVFLEYGPIGEKVSEHIKFGHNGIVDTPVDTQMRGEVSAVFGVCLRPGEYELRNISLYYNNGMVEKWYKARESFSIPMDVSAGQVTYIGRFIAHGLTGENVFGVPISAGGYFTVEDAFEQDWSILQKRYPLLQGHPTVTVVMPTGKAANFLVPRQPE